MAGFEIVVRPVVFPDIRPRPAQPLPPQSGGTFATIHGNGGKSLSVSNSYSGSTSSNKNGETQRRVDVVRVYQKNDDKSVNKSNFVDMEVTNKMWMKGPSSSSPGFNGDENPSTTPGRGFTGSDVVPKAREGIVDETLTYTYQPIRPKDNIEIKEKDKIIRKEDIS